MAEISIMSFEDIELAARWDAEYYQPEYLQIEKAIRKLDDIYFGGEIILFNSGNNIPQTDKGYNFIRTQNIGDVMLKLDDVAYCVYDSTLSFLEKGDLLFTRVGMGVGDCAVIENVEKSFYSDNTIRVALNNINPYYACTFFNTKFGKKLIRRAAKGSAQPVISRDNFNNVRVPILPQPIQYKIEELVKEAYRINEDGSKLYPESQAMLLERMEWEKIAKKPVELFYIEKFSEAQKRGRIDAEHFQPQYKRLQRHLSKMCAKQISNFCPVPIRGMQPEFVENGDILVIDSKAVRPKGVDPSLADRTNAVFYERESTERARLREGDVLLNSTGRGTLGRSTFYNLTEKAIADNHVAIIRPDQKVCLPEYLSLFLNSPAGFAQSEMFQAGSSGQLELYPLHIMQFLIYLPTNKNDSIDLEWQKKLAHKVIQASNAKSEAQAMLDKAKKIIEDSINASM
jgi:type I restriction enzyme S subunit